jgi:hypothetical protein
VVYQAEIWWRDDTLFIENKWKFILIRFYQSIS